MVGSAFLVSGGAADVLDFFSTTFTGTGTGSEFAGEDAELRAGMTVELIGGSAFDVAGVAEGAELEEAKFGSGFAGLEDSWRARLFSSRAAWNSGRSLLKP